MYTTLPKEYREAGPEQLQDQITAARKRLGDKLCILVHHYQRGEVVKFGDHVGDSYGLSKIVAARSETEIVVFCGVLFMAESADILTSEHQKVYLPNPLAGCPMADMAEMADVMEADVASYRERHAQFLTRAFSSLNEVMYRLGLGEELNREIVNEAMRSMGQTSSGDVGGP